MLFIAYIVGLVFALVSSVLCFIIADDFGYNRVFGLFFLLMSLVIIFTLIFNPPLFRCPGCDSLIENLFNSTDFCTHCGYEFIPHCIDCGEICRTAFCKLCGAEQ